MRSSPFPRLWSGRPAVAQAILERLQKAGLALLAFALVVVGLPLLDAGANTPGLEVTLTADPAGSVVPGETLTYNYRVSNGTGGTLSGLDLIADLPDGFVPASTARPTVVRAFTLEAADDFTSSTLDGSFGSHPWTGPWTDGSGAGGPVEDVAHTTIDGDPALLLTGNGSQISRTVDLAAFPAAYLTYRFKRIDLPGQATIGVSVADLETGTPVRVDEFSGVGDGFSDPGWETTTIDISGLAGVETGIVFLVDDSDVRHRGSLALESVAIHAIPPAATFGELPVLATELTLLAGDIISGTFTATVDPTFNGKTIETGITVSGIDVHGEATTSNTITQVSAESVPESTTTTTDTTPDTTTSTTSTTSTVPVVEVPASPMSRSEWRGSLPPDDSSSPLVFKPNSGQATGDLDFIARASGYVITLEHGGAVLALGNGNSPHEIRMTFPGSAPTPTKTASGLAASATGDPTYASVQYTDLYPGIDVVYQADGRNLQYNLVVNPGAGPADITINFQGANQTKIDEDGSLLVDSRAGRNLTATAPYTYQDTPSGRITVDSGYLLNSNGTISFTIGDYDPTLPLIIDPTFKSFDSAGDYYLPGSTIDIPVPAGVVAGDLLIAHIAYNADATGVITPVAGWNTIDELTNPSHPIMQGLYWRVASVSEPAQYSFTITSNKQDTAVGVISSYSGVDTANPIDVFAGQSNGTSTSLVAPSITTTQAGTTLIAFFANRSNGVISPPGGMTERWDVGSNAGVGDVGESRAEAADELLATAGATGTRTAITAASDGSVGHLVALAPATETTPMAVWRRSGQSTPLHATWDGSSFGGTEISQSIGDFRIIQGAESPSRDEAIVVGVDTGGTISGEMWDGSIWAALPVLGATTQNYWWGFDVAYEPVSGDAMVVYADGASLNYRVWDGSTWSAEASIPEPPGGTPRQMQLAAHPYSDEMVLIVSNDSSQDYAVVWNGSSWGNAVTLSAVGTGNDRTDVNVAYEQQSGDALIVYSKGSSSVSRRIWDGSAWSGESSLLAPSGVSGVSRWITLAADPVTDDIVMGVGTYGSETWATVWRGSSWTSSVVATTAASGTTELAVAVAFEGTSSTAVITYGESASTPRYRTWTGGTGWSGELSTPDIGGTPNSMALYPEPGTDGVMLGVNDDSSDINFIYWDGSSWGSPSELETNSGETKNQPFLFLWPGTVGSPPPTYAISGTVFEDIVGDVLNDGTIGDASNPGTENVDVYLYLDDGDANLDAGDTLIGAAPIQTDVNGDYSFTGLADGDYFVIVDSKTVAPSQDPTAVAGDIWAEQTYGPIGGYCDNGIGYTVRVADGPCFGGIAGHLSDDFSQWDDREHRAALTISGSDLSNIDFGFSFNVVTNTAGGNAVDHDTGANRTIQGSLRQFIQNANAISGSNAMRFVPVEPTNATDGTNDWWRIDVTSVLPTVIDADTSIDGTAYDRVDGSTVRDTNTAQIGAGQAVGVDSLITTTRLDPELAIRNDRSTPVARGLDFQSNGGVLRNFSIYGFGTGGLDTDLRIGDNGGGPIVDGVIVENVVVGTDPASNGNPGPDVTPYVGVLVSRSTNGIFRDSLVRAVDGYGFRLGLTSTGWQITGNEFSGNGTNGSSAAFLLTSTGATIAGNLFDSNTAEALIISSDGQGTIDNNTFDVNGGYGIALFSTAVGSVVSENVITSNGGGISVSDPANQNRLTQNLFGGNDSNAIDLTDGAVGGITVNSDTPPSCGYNVGVLGNDGIDAPIVSTATPGDVAGTACAGATVEVYRAVADGDGSDTLTGTDYGEGVEYLGSATADGAGDWSLTGITTLSASDQVSAIAIDGSNNTSEFGANATVSGNSAPVFDQDVGDRSDGEATMISLSSAATDADPLTYSVTGLPLGLSIDSGTGLISGVINHAGAAASPYAVEVSVTDGVNPPVTDTFTWTVTNVVATVPFVVAGSGGAGGGDDWLSAVDETDFAAASNEASIGVGTSTTGIEAIAVHPTSGVVYGVDGGQFGTLDIDSGVFTPIGTGLGTANGSFGGIALDDVRGLAFHPLNDRLFGTHRRAGGEDVFFRIDLGTGSHVANLFGTGMDYRRIKAVGSSDDVTDIAVDPLDWEMYAVVTDGGSSELVTVKIGNGNSKSVGSLAQPIIGLGFDTTGQLWGTSTDTLFQINKSSGTLDAGRTLDNASSYGALSFGSVTALPPAVEGTVFEDTIGNALGGAETPDDATNPGVGGVTVHLYEDLGTLGEPDAADSWFGSTVTGPSGHYYFTGFPAGPYWIVIDSTTISPDAGGSGWAEQTYGPPGSLIDAAFTQSGGAGPVFGGMRPTISDAAGIVGAEHVAYHSFIAGETVDQFDFGFSFNVVTNLEGGDATSPQGSLRQFITNANLGTGPNPMRFVPVVASNASQVADQWWTLNITSSLPAITGSGTRIDGTAYDETDGVTLLNPNAAGPELELEGSGVGGYGLEVSSGTNEIRDLVINRFDTGVAVLGGDANVIAGNYLGPDATGRIGAVGNFDEGVYIYGATNTVIGGTAVADRNVISGNRLRGVFIDDWTDGALPVSDGTQIIGNYLGTNSLGTAALPYSGGATPTYQEIGVAIWAGPNNVIGTASSGNVISGNEWHGVYIWGADASGNKIQGNIIGLNATSSAPVPNGYESVTRSGVQISFAPGNLIGGVGAEGNTISSNSSRGVAVTGDTAVGNAIIGNSIYGNTDLGIDLELDGVTLNDPGDVDTDAGNDLLNFPEITSAVEVTGTITVDFDLDVLAGDYRIEFFDNTTADGTGYGEGETLVHTYNVVGHPGGSASYSTSFVGSAGDIVTATATEEVSAPFGSTSEFSAAFTCTAPDSTPPVITLVGSNPQTIEVGDAYVELGATALDDTDGDITGSIVIDASAVDTGTVGSYSVAYDVADAAGNDAVQVTRTVNVVDTTIPVITLLGDNPQVLEVNTAYVELGATASDNHYGDISGDIVIDTSGVDLSTVGSYSVTYNVDDGNGNSADQVTRTVNVVDTTVPVITLLGDNPQVLEVNTAYVELGATASDNYDGDISGSISIDVSAVDMSTVGSYTVTYDVDDSSGNSAVQVSRMVNVVDTTIPVITLLGDNPQVVEVNTAYVEAGATATDNYDGDISGLIAVDASAVDTSTLGSYVVTYDVADANGNDAVQVTRTVNVVDTTIPVITLLGDNPQVVEVNTAYVEAGATATDNYDGDISGLIVVNASAVDTSTVGSYVVTYDVTDANGNPASGFRTVNVVDTTVPVITLVGADPQTVEVNTAYTELGATASDNYDGDISGSISIDASAVDTSTVGSYTVTYDVTDANGNDAVQVTRSVDVVDSGLPIITLLGSSPIDVEANTVYVDAGATAWDALDGDLTGSIVTVNPVNTAVVGVYTVTYDVTDANANDAVQVTRTVNVVDTTVPVITLVGANPQIIEVGSAYVELGATASDNYDGDITGSIVVDVSGVNTAVVGSYSVTYDVTDANLNDAVQVSRTVDVVDTTVPVITMLGATPVTVEVGSGYVDAGATATDIGDGDLTGAIVTVNPVNTAAVGVYTVTYNVDDISGNSAVQVTRTVNVVDTTVPIITLTGANPQTVEIGSAYTELGATAVDSYDGDISGSIVIDASAVNTSVVGSYAVSYDVTDANGNPAAGIRTVNVVDTTAPVVTLVGANPQTSEVGSAYAELGATAADVFFGDISGSIVIDATGVNTGVVGSYSVTYDVDDINGNSAVQVTRTVNVVDTTIPVITLTGANPQTIEVGSPYVELGATASDAFYGDISGSIVIDATGVNTAVVGSYSVTYDVDDINGNGAVQVTRTVNVVDTAIPTITLLGATPVTVEVGSPYVDAGATAFDVGDGDLTGSIVTVNPVNTAVVDSYTVAYDVSDSEANAAVQVTRTVDVVDTTVPVLTLLGANPQTIEVGSPYVELGATAVDNYDGDISGSIVIDGSAVNTGVVGSYAVSYDVTDANGNPAAGIRIVNVVDTTIPVITLTGANPQTIEINTAYIELGATAADNLDGNITPSIVVDISAVDLSVTGSYPVTYNVSDANGNAAATVTRTVNVVDATAPIITLTGADPQTIEVGDAYVELGASASDLGDGDVSGLIVIDASAVDTGTVGSYSVTYDVSDSSGNPAVTLSRTVNVADTTPPVLTLVGADPQTIEAGAAYAELSATASDVGDGDLTGSIVIDASAVDMFVVGSYTVTYDVSDSSGNAAVTLARTVDVVDTTIPVITLVGADPQVIEAADPYVEFGATAFDVADGDLTGSIVVDASAVDTLLVGSYSVTYDVDDLAGNSGVQVVRTVDVVDTTVPVITLTGANPQTVEVDTAYVELGATALDSLDGDLTGSIVIDASAVDMTTVGSYVVLYDVVDAAGNPGSAIRTIEVTDTTVPVITLVGANPVRFEAGGSYVDPGATAADVYDGDLTSSVVVDSSGVNTGTVGSYTVFYNVSDASGNAAATVTRTVDVVDTNAPTISLIGTDPQVIEVGDSYTELGATASDAAEGDLTSSIVMVSTVDTSAIGSYTVTYDVSDSAGNAAATVSRTVNVSDTTPPVLVLLGSNPMQLFVGDTFADPGATASDMADGDLTGLIAVDASALNLSAGGSYVVVYSVMDSSGNPATAIRVVDVLVPNQPPVAVDDVYAVNEVGKIGVPAPGILGNDSDPEGDPITATLITGPAFGELILNPNGSFTYSHDGTGGIDDQFIYQITDTNGGSDRATVRISLPVLNQPPVAPDVVARIDEDGVARIDVTNGADPDGDELTVAIVLSPDVGVASIDDGTIVYLPETDWSGEVSVGYSLTDTFGSAAAGSISIIVEAVNDAPLGGRDSLVLNNYLATLIDVLTNDSDVEGDSLSIVAFTQSENGTVAMVDGRIEYTPDTGFVGTDTFTYTLSDGQGGTTVVDVSVEVLSSALIAAISLSETVGTDILEIAGPEPLTLARLALDTPKAIRLLTEAVFQSVSAMQLPLILLVLGAFWFLVGGTPWATGLLVKRRYWAVVWVGAEEKLLVHTEPSEESRTAFKLLPTTRGLVSTGRVYKDQTGQQWIPIESESGHGWVKRQNLTEDIDGIEFAADRTPGRLIDRLARAPRRRLGSGLLGTRGMFLSLDGHAVNVPARDITAILTNNHDGEAPSLLDLFLESWKSNNHRLSIDAPLERSNLVPAECKNYHYLNIRTPGSPGWMVFFEYRHGRARIAGLGAEA